MKQLRSLLTALTIFSTGSFAADAPTKAKAAAPAQRREIILLAADLATAAQMADTPTPGKWWLHRCAKDWGAKDDTILMAGQPSEQEVAAAKHEIELPPLNQRLFAMLDVTDESFWNGTVEAEEDIHAMIWRHQQAGFGRIDWRCFGTCLDMLRHPPIAGYEPIVSEAFKKKYGKDMEPLDLYKDPLIQEHFPEYLRAFLVELRQAVGNDIEISVCCSGPDRFGLRGKEFIEAGRIDTIVDAHWYSGDGSRPTIDATVAAVGAMKFRVTCHDIKAQ